MRNTLFRAAAWSLTVLLMGPAFAGTPSAPRYTVTDLGTLKGTITSEALALNDKGQVVGVCSNDVLGKAFLWQKGVMRPLPILSGFGPLSLWPRAINAHGQIVGTAFGPNLDKRRAFLVDNGVIQDLGTPPDEYSEATGINDLGQVIGKSYAETVDSKGQHQVTLSYTYLWSSALGFRRLSPGTNDFGEGVAAINNAGQIVGASLTLGIAEEKAKRAALPPDKQPYHGSMVPYAAFLRQNGKTVSISPPQSWDSAPIALNERGDVLEHVSLYPETDEVFASSDFAEIENAIRHSHHTFLLTKGKMTDLGEMGTETEIAPLAFNNADDIVGYVRLAHNAGFRAFLWRTGQRYMLTDLIPPTAGWILDKAQGINNQGQIIGVGMHHGQRHAFLLTPR